MEINLSDELKSILSYSIEEASRFGSCSVDIEHIVLSIIRNVDSLSVKTLKSLNIDTKELKFRLKNKLNPSGELLQKKSLENNLPLSPQADKMLKLMFLESKSLKHKTIRPEHAILVILKDRNNSISELMENMGLRYQLFLNKLIELEKTYQIETISIDTNKPVQNFASNENYEDDYTYDTSEEDTIEHLFPQNEKNGKNSQDNSLLKFGKDLTLDAANGNLDPVIGRDSEIERLIQILSRRKKNNPILLGEPGVGKTAIAEALALRIANKEVPYQLMNKKIIALDLSSVVAGTKYRGQFEERIKSIINELKKSTDTIVFIDEIHTLVGAGNADGSMDAANIFKPALARGEIRCIGATTLNEYKNSIEKDGALERRFQKLIIEAVTEEECFKIIKGIKAKYEDYHLVEYSDEVLKACISYSTKYITDRFLPDKAIDVMDEAGSCCQKTPPKNLDSLEEEIKRLKERMLCAVNEKNYGMAAEIKNDLDKADKDLEICKNNWLKSIQENRYKVTISDIANVISSISGVPVSKVSKSDLDKLKSLNACLQRELIGQDKAVSALVKAIRRNKIGLKDPNKPIGSFIFLGDTGVGKTYLAKLLAKHFFNSESSLIRFDMSEFSEKVTISRLLGAAPGYIGYEEGGMLTEKVKNKPFSVILFDEIEKAHPEIYNILLQITDEGFVTNSFGKKVDFRNTIIILTSNAGTKEIREFGSGIGFNTKDRKEAMEEIKKSNIEKALKKTFSPEFLNRIDEIIIFDSMVKENIDTIFDLELNKLKERLLESINKKLIISKEAKDYIVKLSIDSDSGARPIKKYISKHIEDTIAEEMGEREIESDTISIEFDQKTQKTFIA